MSMLSLVSKSRLGAPGGSEPVPAIAESRSYNGSTFQREGNASQMCYSKMRLSVIVQLVIASSLLAGCSSIQKSSSSEQTDIGPPPDVHVALNGYGLPAGFFQPDADTKCGSQIIGYRFVVWLNDETVAVGFNVSPNCRQSPDRKVDGLARILVFNSSGVLKAKRDLPYLADGNGELVAQGEARTGPDGTLLFRIESVNIDEKGRNESKSGIRLLDSNLKDVAELDEFLEQTTFVKNALVFQKGITFTLTGLLGLGIGSSVNMGLRLYRALRNFARESTARPTLFMPGPNFVVLSMSGVRMRIQAFGLFR